MKSFLILILAHYALSAQCQIRSTWKFYGGYSIAGQKNLIPSTSAESVAWSLVWHYGDNFLGTTEVGMTFLQNQNVLLKTHRLRYFGFGVGYDVFIKSQKKLRIFLYPEYANLAIVPQTNDFGISRSDWNQFGFKIEATFYVKSRLGISVGYNRYFDMQQRVNNFQSLMMIGITLNSKKIFQRKKD
jgi:hypothetical protein